LVDLGDIEVVRPDATLSPRSVRPQMSLDVNFGRRLRLVGFDLATRVRRPGDGVPLATYWQALTDVEEDYRLWIRLIGADGQLLAEETVSPASAGYPTSRWRAGDVLQGQHRLIVPADALPGTASVVLSVVDPGGRPLTAHRLRWLPIGDTDVRLTTVEIAPRNNVVTEIPPMQHELNARLADGIELLGYDLKSDSNDPEEGTSSIGRGSQLVVGLYWRASAVINGNFKVTVQVLSADNQVVAQHDSVPANWERPTAGWLPGEVIADSHTLSLGPDIPPGTYRVIAAMYDPVSNSRLPVTQDGAEQDHVVLGTLTIR